MKEFLYEGSFKKIQKSQILMTIIGDVNKKK